LRRLLLIACALLACGIAAASALGQDEPISRTLAVTGTGEQRRAAIVVPVRNPEKAEAPVRIRLMREQSGVVVTETDPAPSGLAVSARPAMVPAGQTIPVRVTIALPGITTAAGTMTVSAGLGPTTIVDFSTGPAEKPAATSAQPASVSLLVTTFCPWHKLCEQRREAPVWLSPEQKEDIAERRRLAVSGDGDEVALFLSPAREGQGGPTPPEGSSSSARIRVPENIKPPAGTYTASFPFAGAQSDSAVAATLHVQHWIGWALLTVLVGAVAGQLLTGPAVDQWRKRQELRISITQANSTYEELRSSVPQGGLYHLYDHFESLDARQAQLPPDDVDPNDRLGIEQLYAEVMGARGDAHLTTLQGLVDTLLADVGAWAQVARTVLRLQEAAVGLPTGYGAGKEIHELLDGEPASLATADDVKAHALALRRLGDLAREFTELYRAWGAANPDTRPPEANPQTAYATAKGPLERNANEHADLLERVSTARELLPPAPSEEVVFAFEDLGGGAPAAGAAPVAVPQPGPLRRALDRVNWILWTSTLLIAVVAFTLTMYVGKDFGGFTDYAAAFVAGFSGAAVANVGLVPLVRALGASAV
jgi:hypothetical protein